MEQAHPPGKDYISKVLESAKTIAVIGLSVVMDRCARKELTARL